MGMSASAAARRPEPEINVTPLVDVVLVLLISIRSTDPVLPRRRVSRQSGAHDGNGIEVG